MKGPIQRADHDRLSELTKLDNVYGSSVLSERRDRTLSSPHAGPCHWRRPGGCPGRMAQPEPLPARSGQACPRPSSGNGEDGRRAAGVASHRGRSRRQG